MDKKLVSVIIPIYNVEKFLCKCIDSIINQTYKKLEIILVDDGSPDKCGDICDEYALKDNRIKVIHKENGGLSEARNYGLDVAKGDYIYFIDSDDYAEPDAIEILINIAQEQDADIVIADIRYVDEKGNVLNNNAKQYCSLKTSDYTADSAAYTFADLDWGAWNKLYKKNLYETIRFPVKKIHEDETIMFQLFYNCKKIVYISQQLYNYVKRSGSITSAKYSLKKMHWFEAWINNYFYITTYFPNARDKALSKLLVTAIYNLDNLIDIHSYESERAISEIISIMKTLRKQILMCSYIRINYKIRTIVATSSILLYKLVYR